MTTLTVVIGGKRCGKKLVGFAIARHIKYSSGRLVLTVDEHNMHFDDGAIPQDPHMLLIKPDDIILISGGPDHEPWMEPWFATFGQPLFTINIQRHDP